MVKKKSFWTTLPGILTGTAGVITALTAGYITLNPSHKDTISPGAQPTLSPSATTKTPSPSDWPLVAEGTFTKELSAWSIGNFSTKETPRFDLRFVDGKYRWDIEYSQKWHRWIICPIGSAVNFDVAVDMKVTESSAPETTVNLIFSSAGNEQYIFSISANRYFGLAKSVSGNEQMIIDWTPITVEFVPNLWNRMRVVVDDQLIKLFLNSKLLGEYRDTRLTGGKIGLGVAMFNKGVAVIDFDNLQIRRKP